MSICRCPYWDSGWCYKPHGKYVNGCVGEGNCVYFQFTSIGELIAEEKGILDETYLDEAREQLRKYLK